LLKGGGLQSVQWIGGILRDLQAFFPWATAEDRLASSFSCSQAESTPAPAPQPAGQVRKRKLLEASNFLKNIDIHRKIISK